MRKLDLTTNEQNQDDVHIFVQIETLIGASHWLEFLLPKDDLEQRIIDGGLSSMIHEKFKKLAHTQLIKFASIKDNKYEGDTVEAALIYLCSRPDISSIYDELQGDYKVLYAIIRKDQESLTEICCLDPEAYEQMKSIVNKGSIDVADKNLDDSKLLGFYVEYGKEDGGKGYISYDVKLDALKPAIETIKQMTQQQKIKEMKDAHKELSVLLATDDSETTAESFKRMNNLATILFCMFDGAEEVIRNYANSGAGVAWFFDKKEIGFNILEIMDYDSFKEKREEFIIDPVFRN